MDFNGKLILAPLAGITNSIFRRVCRKMGAEVTWSEMVSADGLVQDAGRTSRLLRFTEAERPFGIQLFGSNPRIMGLAAGKAAGCEPDFIDLNFSCPVRKVVRKNGGASLMRDPKLVGEIARETIRGAGSIPVTAKIRSGWHAGMLNYLEVAEELIRSGISALTLHPRTRDQGFSGQSEWDQISELVRVSTVPVIGSGDVFTPSDVSEMFDTTGCAAVMIGRGAVGNPWIFSRAKCLLTGQDDPGEPQADQRFRLALEHTKMMVEEYGEKYGVIMLRRHFGWYTKGLAEASMLRRKLFACTSLDEVKTIFSGYLERVQCIRTG